MTSTLIPKIHQENATLQTLNADGGPTALIVTHVQIKTLLLALLQNYSPNPVYTQAWEQFNQFGWEQSCALLDYYQQGQEQLYQQAVKELKRVVAAALEPLSEG